MEKPNFIPEVCPHCKQSTQYLVPVDTGAVVMLKAISKKIGQKRINIVHPRKEMETSEKYSILELIQQGKLTSVMVGNLSKLRMHGLIAKLKDKAGNYCMTHKGSQFLKGRIAIPKYAIRSKVSSKTLGYFEPDHLMVHIDDFDGDDCGGFWEGIDYEIAEGRVFKELI